MNQEPELSVVVPLYDESANVSPLVEQIRAALRGEYQWELILVDDGSSDDTAERARSFARSDGRIRLVRLRRNYGQSVAMRAGFDRARAPVVVSMDGDLQNDPGDIPRLVEKIHAGYDLVAGWRKDRWRGQFLKRKLPSLVANGLIRLVTGTDIRDNGCSLRAYRREVLDHLPLYAELHRYLAPVALATSGARVAQVPVRSRSRRHGETKYGGGRVWRVLIDLLTILMIRRFRNRPALMFAIPGSVLAVSGFTLTAAAVYGWISFQNPVLRQSFVLSATALLVLGTAAYLVILGLIGECIVRGNQDAAVGSVHLSTSRHEID